MKLERLFHWLHYFLTARHFSLFWLVLSLTITLTYRENHQVR